MKKFLKVLGITLLVIVVLIIGIFVIALIDASNDEPKETEPVETVVPEETPEPEEVEEAEEVKEAAEEAVEEAEEEEKLTADDIVTIYEMALDQNFSGDGEGYEVKRDGNIILISVWSEGVSEEAVGAMISDKSKDAWNSMVESFKSSSNSFQNVLDENGHSDMSAVITILNDQNHDRVLLVVSKGVVAYDAINGIDLIGD